MSHLAHDNLYKEGFYLCLENSKRLAKIAAMSSQENEFGVACSLNILAGEEAIKAIALIVKHYNPNIEIDGFDKLFIDHRTKHAFLIEASNIITPVVEILYTKHGLFNYIFDMIYKFVLLIPEADRSKFKNDTKPLLDLIEQHTKISDDKINSEDARAWWSEANVEKNKGLYVGRVNSVWHDPKSFTEAKFNESVKYTNSVIENAERMVDLLARATRAR